MVSLALDDTLPSLNSLTIFKVSKVLSEQFEELIADSTKSETLEWNLDKNDFMCNYVVFIFFYADFAIFTNTFDKIVELHEKYFIKHKNLDYPDTLVNGMVLMESYSKTNIGCFREYVNYCERCFRVYPSDSRLFGLYWRAKRCGVDSLNVRRLFESCTKNCDDVRPWLHYLEYEKQRMSITNAVASNQVKILLLKYFLLKYMKLYGLSN